VSQIFALRECDGKQTQMVRASPPARESKPAPIRPTAPHPRASVQPRGRSNLSKLCLTSRKCSKNSVTIT
jgi:hypothetical protein